MYAVKIYLGFYKFISIFICILDFTNVCMYVCMYVYDCMSVCGSVVTLTGSAFHAGRSLNFVIVSFPLSDAKTQILEQPPYIHTFVNYMLIYYNSF